MGPFKSVCTYIYYLINMLQNFAICRLLDALSLIEDDFKISIEENSEVKK